MPATVPSSGIYKLRWSVDAAGTVHFEQVDEWQREPLWTEPFVRNGA